MALLLCLVLWRFESQSAAGSENIQAYTARRCGELVALYQDLYQEAEKTDSGDSWTGPVFSQSTIDAIEARLLENGYDVLDSSSQYPSYLATADRFYEFWGHVHDQESAQQEILSVTEQGCLIYWLFSWDDAAGAAWFSCRIDSPDPGFQADQALYPVLDWEVTDRGNFYFRIRPANDKHYEDYTLVRLVPPDTGLWDRNRQYIQPIGYRAANIFLTDWSESDWKDLSFNDLWEYLYYSHCGALYQPAGPAYDPSSDQYKIPAMEFEQLVLPHFALDRDALRTLARYQPDGDCYLWRPLETDDMKFLWYPVCTPEVTACQSNADGTVTLTVEALSADLKTDCLFAHQVTLRPLPEGGFQYVSNRVTFQTDIGLPFCQPRWTWS